MNPRVLALAQLDIGDDSLQLRSRDGAIPVDVHQYSRFKHGDALVAREFGEGLGEFAAGSIDFTVPRVLVTSSGYDVAPPAAHALVAPFVATLRAALGATATVESFYVRRLAPTPVDYAKLDDAARRSALNSRHLAIDRSISLRSAHVIAVDDVRVTGVHESAMDDALRREGADRVDHLYIADASGSRDPSVEARLNSVAVGDGAALARLASGPGFAPNARFLRLILEDSATAAQVFSQAPSEVLQWIERVGLSDRLARLPRYAAAVQALRASLISASH